MTVAVDTTIVRELTALGIDVDAGPRRLAEYSYDASNYRIAPVAVVFPRTAEEVSAVVRACGRVGLAVISRGGGTSMAGNAIGAGVVLDFTRFMDAVVVIDTDARRAVVEPGVVLSVLTAAVERHTDRRLTFAPDPSSKSRASVGGSIGNDACGNHSVRYGRMADHTIELDVVIGDGTRLTATSTGIRATDPSDTAAVDRARRLESDLRALTADSLAPVRTELGRIARQVSGFHLSHLLPENGFDVAKALVGSEGTCAVIVRATVALVDMPSSALLVVVGYDDVVAAAEDVLTILDFDPAAVEGIDAAIVETMRLRRGPDSVAALPDGDAWLYVDLDGESASTVQARAEKLLARLRENGRMRDGRVVPDLGERAQLWKVREDGAGLSARLSTGASWPGWEDSAVAPENLAGYLAEFRDLLAHFDLRGVMYGHFGAGCMHVRITFEQRTVEGRAVMADFLRAAAALVVRHGGSLSGEHGDGRARSELLDIMYSPEILATFARFKAAFDPEALLNPGSITDPDPMMANLALEGIPARAWRTSFVLHEEAGPDRPAPLVQAAQRCIGVGRCRSDSGGVMCPSYRATHDEKDSTRGRARVLQDMFRTAESERAGWKSTEVLDALDLCLSCKACSTDCPVGVDMSTYKSEFLDHHYRGRRRPMAHYSLGWLPRWLAVTTRVAPMVNAVLSSPFSAVVTRLGGLTSERAMPAFASRRQLRDEMGEVTATGDVVLFVDSFTRGFRPEVAGAAVRVVRDAGHTPQVRTDACCGLTWISTGQLDTARKMLTRTAELLDDGTDRDIVVLEPSCAAALSKDLPELVDTDAARRVAARVRSFAQWVDGAVTSGWTPSASIPDEVTVQTRCHEYSVFGAATQRRALAAVGVGSVREATGCCGVAGNFGFERDHYDVSIAVAEQALAPAIRETADGTAILTDGFSCDMQVRHLTPRTGTHLAQLLDPLPKGSDAS